MIIWFIQEYHHSTAASQERTPVKPPAMPGLPAGQTCWRARWASPVLRTCLIATTRYGRSRNQPLPNIMAAPVVGAEELPNPPALWLSHDGQANSRGYALLRGQLLSGCGWECQGCGELRASCSPERWFNLLLRDKNLLPLHRAYLRWVLQASLSRHGCLSERIFTSEIYMYLHTVQLLAALVTLISIWKHPCILINVLTDPFECIRVHDSTRM